MAERIYAPAPQPDGNKKPSPRSNCITECVPLARGIRVAHADGTWEIVDADAVHLWLLDELGRRQATIDDLAASANINIWNAGHTKADLGDAAQVEIERLQSELAEARQKLERYSRLECEAGDTLGDRLDEFERIKSAERRAAESEKDARRFQGLQNMPVKDAQAFFWNYSSRKQRAAAIDAAIASEAGKESV